MSCDFDLLQKKTPIMGESPFKVSEDSCEGDAIIVWKPFLVITADLLALKSIGIHKTLAKYL